MSVCQSPTFHSISLSLHLLCKRANVIQHLFASALKVTRLVGTTRDENVGVVVRVLLVFAQRNARHFVVSCVPLLLPNCQLLVVVSSLSVSQKDFPFSN